MSQTAATSGGCTSIRKPATSKRGRRPAIVLSPASYNARAGLVVCCPITTRIKGYPFEIPISGQPASVVLADQVKSLDWRVRRATRKGRVTQAELAEVRAKLRALIG